MAAIRDEGFDRAKNFRLDGWPRIGMIPPVRRSPKLDLGDYLPYLVNRVGSIIADQFGGDVLAPHRLSIAMWRVMAALASNGSQRQTDLADLTSIDAFDLVAPRHPPRPHGPRFTHAVGQQQSRSRRQAFGQRTTCWSARLIPIARAYETAAIAGLTGRQELAVLKRCLRRVYDNMKRRPAITAALRTTRRAYAPVRRARMSLFFPRLVSYGLRH